MEQNSGFDDKAKITDLLTSQKQMTDVYNTFLCETETTAVRNCLSGILEEEHRIQEQVFSEMQNRGWYQTEKAEDSKVTQAKQKFAPKAIV